MHDRATLLRKDSLWDRMKLVSADNGLVERELTAAGGDLALHAISLAAVTTSPGKAGGDRATPSAGAIYPYEFYVVLADAVFAVDPVRRLCHRIGAHERLIELRCRQAGVPPPPMDGALVVLVTRPWLSMRKYGDRGYLYTQLDAAHVAVNALGVAGPRAELRLRFAPKPLEGLLGIAGRCREVHSVLHLRPEGGVTGPAGWTVHHSRPADTAPGTEDPSWLELVCWQSLMPLPPTGQEPAPRVEPEPLTSFGDRFGPPPELAPRWAGLSGRRTSAKRYVPAAVPGPVLDRTLAAAGLALRTDLSRDSELGVTLVARSVTGMAPGVYRPDGGDGPGRGEPPSGEEIVRACMHQAHLRDAAAFVVFHAPRADLAADRSAHLRELLFRAGGIAQLLYLGATDAGLGVTAVGGFDAALWRAIAKLPEGQDPAYVMSFGADGPGGVKLDRLPAAYAQNER
ncbi:nitroreductase family protein [Amycolatopsis sp. cmx-4-68]|uniref:nitroreductase family protein n=1 Tax=Amycolatopsis sp. cmx-4-68 TaxID=2790938 RepID=UPI00397C5D27